MMVLLVCSTISNNSIRVPRCIPPDELNNQTIHLVHAHPSNQWHPQELAIIDRISTKYPNYKIHLMLIQPETWSSLPRIRRTVTRHLASIDETDKLSTTGSPQVTTKKILTTKRKKRKIDDLHMSINFEAKRLLDMLLHGKLADNITYKARTHKTTTEMTTSTTLTTTTVKQAVTIEDLQTLYPNIRAESTTFNQAFFNSPLYAYWPYLSDDLKVFAVRVLQLWQYGGISFDLDPHFNSSKSTNTTDGDDGDIYNTKVLKFVIEKNNYEKLPTGVVTVDYDALHMESKIPCHAFFGQILMNLRKAHKNTTVKDVMKAAIKVFCNHLSANKMYCETVI